jgi:hypothetical protein
MAEAIRKVTRHDLEAKIVKRCGEDEAFRKEFTADPAGAFTRYLEVPATDLPKIVVHEETPGSWHIVFPPSPRNIGELSEADLEKVAGRSEFSDLCEEILMPDPGKQIPKLSLVSKVGSAVTAVIASGIGSLIAGQKIDTGW